MSVMDENDMAPCERLARATELIAAIEACEWRDGHGQPPDRR